MWNKLLYVSTLTILLCSCAINDVPTISPTAVPEQVETELVLNPPGELKLKGDCNVTSQLETWLQVTVPIREELENKLSAVVAKNTQEMRADVLSLATIRNNLYTTSTPDCALESQILLTSAFNESIDTLQAIVNGQFTGDLATILIDVNTQLSRVLQLQDELMTRMEQQYKAQPSS